ncbi:MAG: hypothetical protein ACYTFQ_31525 [Planctomycetota bacterium]|jgi:hypothetical protein
MSFENIMRLFNDCSRLGVERPKFGILTKTASYTMTRADFGKVVVTRGATGAVTFTLPAAASTNKGWWALFFNAADQNMIVAGPDEGLTVFNDLTADSISFTTSSEKIGGTILAVSDGTKWDCVPLATETQTITVGTAASNTPSHTPSATPSATVSHTPSHTPSST